MSVPVNVPPYEQLLLKMICDRYREPDRETIILSIIRFVERHQPDLQIEINEVKCDLAFSQRKLI